MAKETTKELFIPKYVKQGILIVMDPDAPGSAQYRHIGLDPFQARNLMRDVKVDLDQKADAYLSFLVEQAYERGKLVGAEEFSRLAEEAGSDGNADGAAGAA